MAEWLRTKEALEFLEENGRSVTKIGLLYIGRRHKIIEKSSDGHHWLYSKKGLKGYLKITDSKIPEDFITVIEAAKKFKISKHSIYYYVKKFNVAFIYAGRRQQMYINEKMYEEKAKKCSNK